MNTMNGIQKKKHIMNVSEIVPQIQQQLQQQQQRNEKQKAKNTVTATI